jgi:hypothetical protein
VGVPFSPGVLLGLPGPYIRFTASYSNAGANLPLAAFATTRPGAIPLTRLPKDYWQPGELELTRLIDGGDGTTAASVSRWPSAMPRPGPMQRLSPSIPRDIAA